MLDVIDQAPLQEGLGLWSKFAYKRNSDCGHALLHHIQHESPAAHKSGSLLQADMMPHGLFSFRI